MSKKEFTATEEALDTFIDDAGFNVDAVSTVEVETFKKTNKENKYAGTGRPRNGSVHIPEDKTVQFKTTQELRLEMTRWAANNNISMKNMLIEGFRLMQKKYGR